MYLENCCANFLNNRLLNRLTLSCKKIKWFRFVLEFFSPIVLLFSEYSLFVSIILYS